MLICSQSALVVHRDQHAVVARHHLVHGATVGEHRDHRVGARDRVGRRRGQVAPSAASGSAFSRAAVPGAQLKPGPSRLRPMAAPMIPVPSRASDRIGALIA